MPTIHTIPLERRNLHGHFSPDLPPALTIAPGDTVRASTLEAGWALEPFQGNHHHERPVFPGRVDGPLDDGHALIGPIFVEGAKPGMTLVVHINAVRPAAWGVTLAGGWPAAVNVKLNATEGGVVHNWTLDAETMTGRNQHGHRVTLRPFLGVMGMPPAEPGVHSTIPPRPSGGNMDCKELIPGTTLYLPIPVEGALFSFGDGHASQGDGEICITAIECGMELVELSFDLRDDFPLNAPVACTPTGWIALAFDADLNAAAIQATESMLALMQRLYKLERYDALALASISVDLHITQIVNEVAGVHAILPHGKIQV